MPRRSHNLIGGSLVAALAVVCVFGLLASPTVVEADMYGNATPPDSFLTTQVTTVNELVYEVNSNPRIRDHYAKLFHVAPEDVAHYFKHNLVITTLSHNYYGQVYCVHPGTGLVYVTTQRIDAGTKVFSLRNGRPLLKWACGNPLTSVLPPVREASAVTTPHHRGRIAQAPATPLVTNGAGDHGQPIAVATNDYVAPTNVFTPTEEVMPYSETFPPTTGPTDFNVPVVGGGSPFQFPFAALALIPVAYVASQHSSSSNGLVPAPEADTDIIWPIGGLAIGLAFFLNRKNKSLSS